MTNPRSPPTPIDQVEQGQGHEGESQQDSCQLMGISVIQALDLVVNSNGNDPRFCRNIPSDHQHDAKLTERVRKPHDRRR